MTETELRELLKLMRGVVKFIEGCLKSETEKNEERIRKQLEQAGVTVSDCICETREWDDDPCPVHLSPPPTGTFEF